MGIEKVRACYLASNNRQREGTRVDWYTDKKPTTPIPKKPFEEFLKAEMKVNS